MFRGEEMEEKKIYQSWTISDEFWDVIKEDIPKKEQDPKKKYVHALGQSRRPMASQKSAGRHILCAADRVPVESSAPGIWQREHSA